MPWGGQVMHALGDDWSPESKARQKKYSDLDRDVRRISENLRGGRTVFVNVLRAENVPNSKTTGGGKLDLMRCHVNAQVVGRDDTKAAAAATAAAA